jgi:hypothetical protein
MLHISLCKHIHMPTNLALDDRLIEEARRVGRHKTKREAVSAALAEYVKRRKQLLISVWSLAPATKKGGPKPRREGFENRVAGVSAGWPRASCGPVRQELLSGIRAEESFRKVRDALRAFDEPQLWTQDYEEAAYQQYVPFPRYGRVGHRFSNLRHCPSAQLGSLHHRPRFRPLQQGSTAQALP